MTLKLLLRSRGQKKT